LHRKAVRALFEAVPQIEKIVAHEGIFFFKFYLDIGREMQLKRFHDRRFDQRAIGKLSDLDIAALGKWDDYTDKRNRMLKERHTDNAPWTVVRANDKHRARLNLIRHMLTALDYEGKDAKAIGEIDRKIIGSGPGVLE
jgi:polyphosphate kinase